MFFKIPGSLVQYIPFIRSPERGDQKGFGAVTGNAVNNEYPVVLYRYTLQEVPDILPEKEEETDAVCNRMQDLSVSEHEGAEA